MPKIFYTPLLKKEGDKYAEFDKAAMNYQYHDFVSILYSFILVEVYSANAIMFGANLKGKELK